MKVLSASQELDPESCSSKLDALLLRRFLEEVQITSQLDHPGIITLHELGIDSCGRVYFTMPLVRGLDLAEVLKLVREERERC